MVHCGHMTHRAIVEGVAVSEPMTLTREQRDGLLRAGIIVAWGAQYTADPFAYVLAPGMTWDDVHAATGVRRDA